MIQKRKVLALVVCLMIVGLITSLTSGCAPSNGDGDGDGDGAVQPQYGGVLNVYTQADPVGWDDAVGNCPHYNVPGCYQTLWSGDWSKGIAGGYGTKEADWFIGGDVNRLETVTGRIADSWELGEDYITFHLRDGVRWEDRFPTNGREVTADDVVVSINRHTEEGAYLRMGYPALAAAMSASKVDESTVRIDCTAEEMPELLSMIDFMYIFPADVIETFGDMNDWERAIGTGPFYVKEYVPGSCTYLEKNPVYWETNPVVGSPGYGDQLPYLDGVNRFIQPDPSTQDSLFTTGQVDITMVEYDRAQVLITLPGVKYVKWFTSSGKAVICMRTDDEDKPYSDLRVRQALMLGIDHQKMVDELYGGEGEYLYWPVSDCKEYHGTYLELEDYPDEPVSGPEAISVKDLYTYNPTKAQELLADAGYSDGFKAEIFVWNLPIYIDQLQVVADMWADIGVDLTIKPVDYATISVRMYYRNYEDMMYFGMAGAGTYFKGTEWYGSGMWNGSYINDPVLNDYRDQMIAAWPDEEEMDSIHRQLLPYLQEQCYVIQTVGWNTYTIWWPWVKNYSGEGSLGYYKLPNNGFGGLTQYIWIDQDLKESMGYGD
jgi:peptide/nickel transport system substrate-binding protein